MSFQIIKATKSDFNDINSLFIEMLETIYKDDGFQGYSISDLEHYFNESNDFILLAKCNGKTIGFLSVENHEDFLYLDDFSVAKKYRGKGIGNSLMEESFKYGLNNNITEIKLHVEEENKRVYDYYLKLGFEAIEKQGTRLLMKKEIR